MAEFLQDAQVRVGLSDDVRRVLHLRAGICDRCSNACLTEGGEVIQVVAEIDCLLDANAQILL